MADITAKLVKDLRDKTGAGMMDCKKALAATDGEITKAIEWLRQKGIASAEKKSGRVAAEGAVGSYIHTGARVGVLVELNCETDFVARGELFQGLLKDVAMQIAASAPLAINKENLDINLINKEKEIIKEELKNSGKETSIADKIAMGKINKFINDNTLLNQEWIMEPKKKVKDIIKEFSNKDPIKIKKFIRYKVGEGV